MARYLAKSPVTGVWFRAPEKGSTLEQSEAHAYAEDDPWLALMVRKALQYGRRLHLREAPPAQAEPTGMTCPECKGAGDAPNMPYFDCFVCDGTGVVDA